MKIKYQNSRGKRTIVVCLNCDDQFETLEIKVRGGEKFCCIDCYQAYRDKNKADEKQQNIFYQKKHKYGLTKEDYLALFEEQGNCCAICGINEIDIDGERDSLCVDHDHETKQVRGLLCDKCNRMLGYCSDSIEILQNAINYLAAQTKA